MLSTFRARIVRSCYRRPEDDVVVGLGVDLVELGRVAKALDRWGSRLVGKLMDAEEAGRLPADAAERARALALAIAGKEAASKALGTGWSRGVRWRDVEVRLRPEPAVGLRGGAAARARALGSSGRTWARLELRDELAVGEVRLLS
jgi:holo-[acyl-carrier protein] synthase